MTTTYRNYIVYFFGCLALVLNISCQKQDSFLNAKPNQALFTISTITDVQNLLNNQSLFNKYNAPAFGEMTTDDLYVTTDTWNGDLEPSEQNAYLFDQQIFGESDVPGDWSQPYEIVYNANTVLDALPKISAPQDQLDQAKGMALFYRAFAFYGLVQTFALPYDSVTANTDLGIPLRQNSDLNTRSVRSTEQQSYDQILSDLKSALQLLPITSTYNTLPNKVSANAMLARVYLEMGNYPAAYLYADSSLSLNSSLLDYNNIVAGPFYLFEDQSQYPMVENIYESVLDPIDAITGFGSAVVDSNLYAAYDSNDLRKTAFFTVYNNYLRFKGSYEFLRFGLLFNGLATDEMYLIRAECNARAGNITAAMDDLNALLVKRYKTGTFINRTAASALDALTQILLERRKELIFRGLRWEDLRRLNQDPRFAVTLTHIINGVTYTLPPKDPRYAISIPPQEIQISGIPQNPR